jgi:hypothetical protein
MTTEAKALGSTETGPGPKGGPKVEPTNTVSATPQMVKATGQARENYARVIIGGCVLGCLSLALVVALVWRPDQVTAIAATLGTMGGFLLGPRPQNPT